MSKTVYIMGAGASAPAGAPVMCEFLQRARDLLNTGKAEAHRPAFENVFRGIEAIKPAVVYGHLDLDNLESIFTAFESAAVLGVVKGYENPAACAKLIADLRILIVHTLEMTANVFDGKHCSPGYSALAQFFRRRGETKHDWNPSILTFNYDCCLDYALHREDFVVQYGLSDNPKCDAGRTACLAKLHGSLNWAKGVNGVIGYVAPANFQFTRLHGETEKLRHFVAEQARSIAGGEASENVIVPPTLSKGDLHLQLGNVWRMAAALLAQAEAIVVIGYSLPRTDEFFRNLFSLGTSRCTDLRRIVVYDKFANDQLMNRFKDLLARTGQERLHVYCVDFAKLAPEACHIIDDPTFLNAAEGCVKKGFAQKISHKS